MLGKGPSIWRPPPPKHYVTIRVCVSVFQHPVFPICTEQLPSWCFWGLNASLLRSPLPPPTQSPIHIFTFLHLLPVFIALLCEGQLALSLSLSDFPHSAGKCRCRGVGSMRLDLPHHYGGGAQPDFRHRSQHFISFSAAAVVLYGVCMASYVCVVSLCKLFFCGGMR